MHDGWLSCKAGSSCSNSSSHPTQSNFSCSTKIDPAPSSQKQLSEKKSKHDAGVEPTALVYVIFVSILRICIDFKFMLVKLK